MGSKFSIEQTTTQLSARSRITSISNSFQPSERFFDQNFFDGREIEAARGGPVELLAVIGDPAARSAERERRTNDQGNVPITFATRLTSAGECATPDRGTSSPMRNIASLNS